MHNGTIFIAGGVLPFYLLPLSQGIFLLSPCVKAPEPPELRLESSSS